MSESTRRQLGCSQHVDRWPWVKLVVTSLELMQGGESASDTHQEGVSASLPVYSQEGLAAVMPVLTSNHAPAVLQAAAQVGDAGFASTIAHVLQQSLPLQQVSLCVAEVHHPGCYIDNGSKPIESCVSAACQRVKAL